MPQPAYLAVQFNTATLQLDTTPQFDPSLIYPYSPPEGQTLTASGTIVNGSLVTLINVAGNLKATLASANASCSQGVLQANGFVLASYNNGDPIQVFLAGLFVATIPGASAANIGNLVYLSDSTPGATSLTAPLPNKVWTPNTAYNLSDQIVDGNGNWQTVTSIGSAPHQSGATEPLPTPPGGGGAWSTTCNGFTTDGNLTWQMSPAHLEQVVGTIVYYNAVTNQCTINFQFLANIGAVSSVGLSMPSDFSVGNSPIITAGTFQVAWLPQNANLVHAGPVSGGPAVPTWRNLVAADFGLLTTNVFLAGPVSGGSAAGTFRTIAIADLFGGTGATATTYLRGDGSWHSAVQTLQVNGVPFSSQSLLNFFAGSGVGIVDSGGGTITFSNTITTYDFADITSGTNTTAVMTVGGGAILTFSTMGSPPSTGVINANALYGVAISSVPPTEGQSLVATSSSTAEWQTVPLAGVVSIVGPSSSQAVTYSTPYTTTNAPIVLITALNTDPSSLGGVWITNQGSAGNWTGFTVNVTTGPPASPPTSVEFNYAIMSAQS